MDNVNTKQPTKTTNTLHACAISVLQPTWNEVGCYIGKYDCYMHKTEIITQDKITISTSKQQLISTVFVNKTNQTVQTFCPKTLHIYLASYL
jgi:hypothetical protein